MIYILAVITLNLLGSWLAWSISKRLEPPVQLPYIDYVSTLQGMQKDMDSFCGVDPAMLNGDESSAMEILYKRDQIWYRR